MEKLKILLVTTGVMTNVLGVLKVHHDLKEEYEKQGHTVDVLDFSVIYPNGRSAYNKIFGKFYTYKFWKYLQKHAFKYDVIDANNEIIIYPKESFGFKGVLLARSHGISPLYRDAENIESYKIALTVSNNKIKLKTKIGNFYRSLQKYPSVEDFYSSINCADLVHCLNEAEYKFFVNSGIPEEKILLIPNGLPDDIIKNCNKIKKINTNSLCFIGSWTIRKGIKDLNNIITLIRENIDIQHFFLLGGHYEESYTRKDFDGFNQSILQITPLFEPKQIDQYVNTCKVGIFPSYVEGFPLAVVEQLACGIPIVAYDVPGPKDILSNVDIKLLVEPGNKKAFASKVVEILNLNEDEYSALSQKCIIHSKKYLLSNISKEFINAYTYKLKEFKEL